MRINDELKEKIRTDYAAGGVSQATLAMKYGVSKTTIARILNPAYRDREREKNRIRARSYEQPKAAYAVHLRFYEDEQPLIDKVKSVDNIQQYVKGLIAKDIATEES